MKTPPLKTKRPVSLLVFSFLSIFTGFTLAIGGETPSPLVENCARLLSGSRPTSTIAPNANDAAVALGLSGDERAVILLASKYQNEPSNELRLRIVRSLGWLRFPSALPTLQAAANDSYRFIPDAAARATSIVKGEVQFQGYSRSAVFAAGQNSTHATLERCAKILTYGEVIGIKGPSRTDAVITLGLLGDEQAIPLLVLHLENEENQNLRYQIVRALGWINSPAVVPALEQALQDPYIHVRKSSAQILQQITGQEYAYDHTGEAEGRERVKALIEINRPNYQLRQLELDSP